MNGRTILCIDKGQSAVKAALYDFEGKELCLASRPCATISDRRPGWLEQSMQIIWEDTVLVVRELLKNARAESIAAVSFSGHGGGLFLLDAAGQPLCPGMLSMDSRSDELRRSLIERGELDLGSAMAISHVALKLRWMKENEPAIYRKTAAILGAKDYIRYRLTGVLSREVTDPPVPVFATALTYDNEAFYRLDLEDCIAGLPPLCLPSDIVGTVTEEAAALTGIPAGTWVVAGAHDMMACSAGVGGYEHGHITSILGTMGINVAVVEEQLLTARVPELRHHVLPGLKIKINNMGSACRSLDWYAMLLYQGTDLTYTSENKGSFYSELNRRLDCLSPSGILCLPYLNGEMRGARVSSGFSGISYTSSRDDLMRSVFEGVAFAEAERLLALFDQVGVAELWMVGGGSKSRLICQTVANALGKEVFTSGSLESGCRGGALCAHMALNSASPLWIKPVPEHVFRPEKDNISECADRFARFIAFKQGATV